MLFGERSRKTFSLTDIELGRSVSSSSKCEFFDLCENGNDIESVSLNVNFLRASSESKFTR